MYNPKSLKAEEFISHEEIQETLAFADANKNNVELIDSIIEKAKRKVLLIEKPLFFLPVKFQKKTKKFLPLQRK